MLAFVAVKEKGNVILEVKNLSKKLGEVLVGRAASSTYPTHSSVSEFPLFMVGSSVNEQFAH